MIPTNIHLASALLKAQRMRSNVTDEEHEAQRAPMTLAAACASLRDGSYPYFPARSRACGCGKCGR